jgi:hypothetical protein
LEKKTHTSGGKYRLLRNNCCFATRKTAVKLMK